MAFDFSAGRKSKGESKVIGRGSSAPIKRTYEDTPTAKFDAAFKVIGDIRITNQDTQARLRRYRDLIPFVAKRSNQSYLAAALVLWHQLGEPSLERLDTSAKISSTTQLEQHEKKMGEKLKLVSEKKESEKRKGKKHALEPEEGVRLEGDVILPAAYLKVADPILRDLVEHVRSISRGKESSDVQVVRADLTLFRYVCSIASAVAGVGICKH